MTPNNQTPQDELRDVISTTIWLATSEDALDEESKSNLVDHIEVLVNNQVCKVLDRLEKENGFGCTHKNKFCDAVNLCKEGMRDAIEAERKKYEQT